VTRRDDSFVVGAELMAIRTLGFPHNTGRESQVENDAET
jgi:hypothetical protein